MAQYVSKQQQALLKVENDVTSLFSHFGDYSKRATYHEVVRQDAALVAASRWPLLAEIEGVGSETTTAEMK